jgi:hypothetical protein
VGYTTIRSPVEGVVVDRRITIGQTVVANPNALSLFLIAKNLCGPTTHRAAFTDSASRGLWLPQPTAHPEDWWRD